METGIDDERSNLPEAPLLCAGLVGGPLVIGVCTPFRNCLALASQDASSTIGNLWKRVFSGCLRTAYRGGLAPMPASMIQFSAVGPLYHILNPYTGPVGAVALSAGVETAVIFGPERRNVQLAFNESTSVDRRVALKSYFKPWGAGVLALYGRNFVANSGIRVLSDPLASVVRRAFDAFGATPGDGVCKVAGDFLSSLACGAGSLPFNQAFYFSNTSKEMQEAKSLSSRRVLVISFLRSQYFTGSGGVSRILARDMAIRSSYIGVLFTLFAGVERVVVGIAQSF